MDDSLYINNLVYWMEYAKRENIDSLEETLREALLRAVAAPKVEKKDE